MATNTISCAKEQREDGNVTATEEEKSQISDDIILLCAWYQNKQCCEVAGATATKDINAAQNRVLNTYQGLIKSLAYKFSPNSSEIARYDFDDLVQEAKLGFLKALQHYNPPGKHIQGSLPAFARFYIVEALHTFILGNNYTLNPFKSQKSKRLRRWIIQSKQNGQTFEQTYYKAEQNFSSQFDRYTILLCVNAIYKVGNKCEIIPYCCNTDFMPIAFIEDQPTTEQIIHKPNLRQLLMPIISASFPDIEPPIRYAYFAKRGYIRHAKFDQIDAFSTNQEIAEALHRVGISSKKGHALHGETIRNTFKDMDMHLREQIITHLNISELTELI